MGKWMNFILIKVISDLWNNYAVEWLLDTSKWTREWINEQIREGMIGVQMKQPLYKWMVEWMDGWMDRWMNGWMDEWMDGWINEWMDE